MNINILIIKVNNIQNFSANYFFCVDLCSQAEILIMNMWKQMQNSLALKTYINLNHSAINLPKC